MNMNILFLCTGNACRSQMAEGWARHLHGEQFRVWSAGVAPSGVDPRAVRIMQESGVDISEHHSKHVDSLRDIPFDLVVTVCDSAAEVCPVFPGRVKVLHRGFEDPPRLARGATSEDVALDHYRRVSDQIRDFVQALPGIIKEQGPA